MRKLLALVVDDDPLVRMLAGRVLRRAGMGCLGFASADDALPVLADLHGEVDVLVTDIHMPGSSLDGLGLARHAAAADPGLAVVVMSGDADALLEAADLAAVSAVLDKPFPPAELVRLTLAAALSRAAPEVS